MSQSTALESVQLDGFRSITTPVEIPVDQPMVLIGPNNAGKSSVLDGLVHALRVAKAYPKELALGLPETDIPPDSKMHRFRAVLRFSRPEGWEVDKSGWSPCAFEFYAVDEGRNFSVRVHGLEEWIERQSGTTPISDAFTRWFPGVGFSNFSKEIAAQRIGEAVGKLWLSTFSAHVPAIRKVDAFRKPTGHGAHEAAQLAKDLANWRDPPSNSREEKAKFRAVETLVQGYLGMPDAQVGVRGSDKAQVVTVDGPDGLFDLARYGAGLQDLVLLAAEIERTSSGLLAVEEPEVHMHPRLQRRFAADLVAHTRFTSILSTHSPPMIDAVVRTGGTGRVLQIQRVKKGSGAVRVRHVEHERAMLDALAALGSRPSDLLMANYVVWVEGPSDRVLINHWLGCIDPGLRENVDYAVLFYGGRLLAQLKIGSETESPLCDILPIARQGAIVMDSDRRSAADELNDTKKRIMEEAAKHGHLVWVTDGREIENYLDPEAIALDTPIGQFDSFTDLYAKANLGDYSRKKVQVAQSYAKSGPERAWNLDLEQRVRDLARAIAGAWDAE